MVKLGEKSICLLCKQVACVKMSPAEDWDGGNVCLRHTWMPKLGLFLCVRLCQEAKTSFFMTFPLGCPFHASSSCTCCQEGRDLCGVSPRPWVTSAFLLSGRVSVLVSFQDQLDTNLLGSLEGICEGIPTLFVAWQAQYYS